MKQFRHPHIPPLLPLLPFLLLIILSLPASAPASSQPSSARHPSALHRFRCMEYNVENLFDTIPSLTRDDADFLPDGPYAWTSPRYWRKQGALARVILHAGALQPVDLIALCEVENDSVLYDLTRRTRLAALDYAYVITHSPDLRGINVALLYQPATYRLIATATHTVPTTSAPTPRRGRAHTVPTATPRRGRAHSAPAPRPTRDILHCTGVIPTGDTLDVIVVHFPSRRTDSPAAARQRMQAAHIIRALADSLHAHRTTPAVLIMGDCNDEPRDPTLRHLAQANLTNLSASSQAYPDPITATPLPPNPQFGGFGGDFPESPSHPIPTTPQPSLAGPPPIAPLPHITGTYNFQQSWSRIDNILLTTPAVPRYQVTSAIIFAPDYLLEQNAAGFPVPRRTYRGPTYHGGTSDHLPLLLDLWY